jgi:hypothetical protein
MSDTNQKARLIFDTGSDYLAMTSSLCEDTRFGSKFKNAVNKSVAQVEEEARERNSGNSYDAVPKSSMV